MFTDTDTNMYMCVLGGKKCQFFGNIYARTKWITLAWISVIFIVIPLPLNLIQERSNDGVSTKFFYQNLVLRKMSFLAEYLADFQI